jgi:hypothetical protein
MTHAKGTKLEPRLKLDMSFGEAMERFAVAKPSEVEANVDRSKKETPPEPGQQRRRKRTKSPGRKRAIMTAD